MKTIVIVLLVSGVAVFAGFNRLTSGDKVVVGKAVPASQQVSMDQIDHSNWNALLQKYVNDKGEVDYRSWKASDEDQRILDTYLNHLSTGNPNAEATTQSQLAFWINAYNAVTVKGILREYPTSSIRNHTAKVVGYNIWKDLLLVVGDQQISLDSMEHQVLRKMNEPRIHFAIVCASYSCPRLLNQAYTADALEEQLVTNTQNFFSNPENFQFDQQRNRFQLSSILNWFGKDFGQNKAEVLSAIAPYLPTEAAQQAASRNQVDIRYLKYDWSLNEQKSSTSERGR